MMIYILRYGLVYGLALGMGFFVSHLLLGNSPDNFAKGEVIGYSVMIISSLAVVFAIKDYKETRNNGQLGFLTGFSIGAAVSAIAGLLFGVYNMIYLRVLNPEFTAVYIQYSEEQILNSGAEQSVIDTQLEELARYGDLMSNDYLQSALMFLTVFLIGLLFSLVSAAAMRTPAQ